MYILVVQLFPFLPNLCQPIVIEQQRAVFRRVEDAHQEQDSRAVQNEDKDGKLLIGSNEMLKHWTESCIDVFNYEFNRNVSLAQKTTAKSGGRYTNPQRL